MYKATQLSACVASARWRVGERSRSGGVRSVARRALTLLNVPLVYVLLVHLFILHARGDFCPPPLRVGGWLRLVVVALPGFFSSPKPKAHR